LFVRTRFQYGSLRLRKRERGPDVWEFRYYETDSQGQRKRQSVILGDRALYTTETQARKATQALLLRLNGEAPRTEMQTASFTALLDRYIEQELPTRYSTRKSHLSNIRVHIRPRWSDYPLDKMKPMAMEQWLRELPLAPKSKTHIRGIMHLVFKCAERWGIIELGKNPVSLVRVKDASKRLKRPRVLTVDEFFELLKHLSEPYSTMVLVAQCLGLRVSEILGLRWGDFDFEKHTVLVQRSIVGGRVDDVKTEYSKDDVPLDSRLAEVLLQWRSASTFQQDSDWVFANPSTKKPYHQESLQKTQLKRAAKLAKLGDGIGWHTFRHTYRSWLDETGAPMKVQQELMRHASIQTTMNVYGRAMTETKRRANSQVVGLVFGPNSQESAVNAVSATVQ
jgi:integrase